MFHTEENKQLLWSIMAETVQYHVFEFHFIRFNPSTNDLLIEMNKKFINGVLEQQPQQQPKQTHKKLTILPDAPVEDIEINLLHAPRITKVFFSDTEDIIEDVKMDDSEMERLLQETIQKRQSFSDESTIQKLEKIRELISEIIEQYK
jgi:hypothetical protein